MTTDISLVRWDPTLQQEIVEDYEYDGGNSSSRLFERSRIKALAGKCILFEYIVCFAL
jgi:spectrin beta